MEEDNTVMNAMLLNAARGRRIDPAPERRSDADEDRVGGPTPAGGSNSPPENWNEKMNNRILMAAGRPPRGGR